MNELTAPNIYDHFSHTTRGNMQDVKRCVDKVEDRLKFTLKDWT